MYTQKDDGTCLRQLTNKDLVTYAVGRQKLTQLELELTLRLEEIVHQREEWYENIQRMACGTCPVLRKAAPHVDGVIEDVTGDTVWA